jgi:2-dehydro-3-deoxyglucarate aldolase/4-hydroxy-2-oxoheptanedioate aldolase
MNAFKQKILNKQKTSGIFLNSTDTAFSIITARAGYDFVWLDLEHSYISFEQAAHHVYALKKEGVAVIVRVPENELTWTKKVLEMGVDGIIFPMVRTAAQADAQIKSTLYPPYGTRGFGPHYATSFGHDDAWEYVKNSKDDLCRFIQIEHVSLIEELDEVMKNEFIDGYIFGPNDLSGSINDIGNVFSDKMTEIISTTTDRLHKNGKYVGLATGDLRPETLKFWSELGIDMMTVGADWNFVFDAAKNTRNLLQKYHMEA